MMWLPVMDYKNQAIANPTARQISDTKMRCLVKCISMFGLGHYIYAGEDLPNSEASAPPVTHKAPTSKRKLTKVQQEQLDDIRKVVTTHAVFTNNNGGTELQKRVLGIIDENPTPAEISEWQAFVIGEASLHDNKQSDLKLRGK